MSDSIEMTAERWQRTTDYVRSLFCRKDAHLASVMDRAAAQGLPLIDAGPATGRLLQMLALVTQAQLAIEVGTLAGNSAIWIARGLAPGGRLITIEASGKHGAIAQHELELARVDDRVHIRQGRGIDLLAKILSERGPGCADLIFFDAERSEYLPMLDTAHRLLRVGGVLAIDNCLAAKTWTADPVPVDQQPDVMDTINRRIANDARFVSLLHPIGNGVLVAVRRN